LLIFDARQDIPDKQAFSCEVCIVGAGAAGLYLATRLAELKVDTVVLEAGNVETCIPQFAGFETSFPEQIYEGANKGRGFGLGGTTALWGGVLAPYTTNDSRQSSDESAQAWGRIIELVNMHSATVLKRLGFEDPATCCESVPLRSTQSEVPGLRIQNAEVLPFGLRNFRSLLPVSEKKPACLRVVVNAVVNHWITDPHNQATKGLTVLTSTIAHSNLSVQARVFVIAAGAIETTRILLEINRGTGLDHVRHQVSLGRFLGDHLSCAIARPEEKETIQTIKRFGPKFRHGRIRMRRLVPAVPGPFTPKFFAHFVFDQNSPGFVLARSVLSARQKREWPELELMQWLNGASGLVSLAWRRLVYQDLHIPAKTPIRLHVDMEQIPSTENRVFLQNETDVYGRQKAAVNWAIRSADFQQLEALKSELLAAWGHSEFLPAIRSLPDTDLANPYGTYHPVGTTRMGPDRESTLTLHLQVRGFENLYALSTAAFPSAGTANPTFSLLCMAEMLVGNLYRNLKSSQRVVED